MQLNELQTPKFIVMNLYSIVLHQAFKMCKKSFSILFYLTLFFCLLTAFNFPNPKGHVKKNNSASLQAVQFFIWDIQITEKTTIDDIYNAEELVIIWNLSAAANSVEITPSLYIPDLNKYILIETKKNLINKHEISGPIIFGNQRLSSDNINDAFYIPNTDGDFTSLTFTNINQSGPIGYRCQVKDSKGGIGQYINTNPSPPKLKKFFQVFRKSGSK